MDECALAAPRHPQWRVFAKLLDQRGRSHALRYESLDLVAGLHIAEILNHDAALLTGAHFADIVLEALQRRNAASVNDHAVAQEANGGALLQLAFRHQRAR